MSANEDTFFQRMYDPLIQGTLIQPDTELMFTILPFEGARKGPNPLIIASALPKLYVKKSFSLGHVDV